MVLDSIKQRNANAAESNVIGDDSYLVEMSDRLHRLRSLLGQQETRNGSAKRWNTFRSG